MYHLKTVALFFAKTKKFKAFKHARLTEHDFLLSRFRGLPNRRVEGQIKKIAVAAKAVVFIKRIWQPIRLELAFFRYANNSI